MVGVGGAYPQDRCSSRWQDWQVMDGPKTAHSSGGEIFSEIALLRDIPLLGLVGCVRDTAEQGEWMSLGKGFVQLSPSSREWHKYWLPSGVRLTISEQAGLRSVQCSSDAIRGCLAYPVISIGDVDSLSARVSAMSNLDANMVGEA